MFISENLKNKTRRHKRRCRSGLFQPLRLIIDTVALLGKENNGIGAIHRTLRRSAVKNRIKYP
jgi:hypothetical protein